MKKDFEEDDFEFEDSGFLNALAKLLPKESVKMINPERYNALLQTAAELKAILNENEVEGQVKIDIDEIFNSGAVCVQLSDLTIYNIPQFIKMISNADNFEVYPRVDGTVQFNITFYSVLKTIAYRQ